MGVVYRCNADNGSAIVVWDGDVTTDDALRHFQTVSDDPAWLASRLFITDLTSVSGRSRSVFATVARMGEEFLEQLARRIERAKWAVIADSFFDDVLKLETHINMDVHRMMLFSNLATACVWMSIDAGEAQSVVNDLRRELREAE